MNLTCKISLKLTLEDLPGTDRERFGVETSVWKEKDPFCEKGEKLTSTTDGPEIDTKYSGAPAGVCPGARPHAGAGKDRA